MPLCLPRSQSNISGLISAQNVELRGLLLSRPSHLAQSLLCCCRDVLSLSSVVWRKASISIFLIRCRDSQPRLRQRDEAEEQHKDKLLRSNNALLHLRHSYNPCFRCTTAVTPAAMSTVSMSMKPLIFALVLFHYSVSYGWSLRGCVSSHCPRTIHFSSCSSMVFLARMQNVL